MSAKFGFARRSFLKGLAGAAGAAVGARLPGAHLIGDAFAQTAEPSHLLVVFLRGGYNALFTGADAFSNVAFGVTAGNVANLGNGLVVDSSFAKFGAFAKAHMASVGVAHGISNHGGARTAQMSLNGANAALTLAAGMGGGGSIKAARVGTDASDGPNTAVNGVSLQPILDMDSTIRALGGGTPDVTVPDRAIAAKALLAADVMSANSYASNPRLASMKDGFGTAVQTLQKPVQPFSFATLAAGYSKPATGTAVNDFTSKMMAAELMFRAGANLAIAVDNGWDSHGDRTGTNVRNMMNTRILPGLVAFANRMIEDPTERAARNVTILITGDFSRSLPGSDHQPNLSTTVIGKYVKLGTTGKTNANVGLPAGTPGINGLWGYLAAVTKAPAATLQAFGGNPHAGLVL
jgi:hypothetical protein